MADVVAPSNCGLVARPTSLEVAVSDMSWENPRGEESMGEIECSSAVTNKPIELLIKGHLIIPFGCPKWDIDKIKIKGVSTKGTYITSTTPCLYIDVSAQEAVRVKDIEALFPGGVATSEDAQAALEYIREHLKQFTQPEAKQSEDKFLDIYFGYLINWLRQITEVQAAFKAKNIKVPEYCPNPEQEFGSFLPIPQAHIYASNPLDDRHTFLPEKMMKVDFAFWTGTKMIAVEIDGGSHIGNQQHVIKDRLLQRIGVQTIHIMVNELQEYGQKVLELLPFPVIPQEPTFYNPFGSFDLPF